MNRRFNRPRNKEPNSPSPESIQQQADLLAASEIAAAALRQYDKEDQERARLQQAIDSIVELKRRSP